MTDCYVIIAEWCVDYEQGHELVGCYPSEEAAKEAFADIVVDYVRSAAQNGYDVIEDTDGCFDSGMNGEYISDHIYVGIERCANFC